MPVKKSRQWVLAGGVLAVALVAGLVAVWPRSRVNLPNIAIIVLDTVRDDQVGAAWHGVPLTPCVDAITAEGTRFSNAFSAAPWTVPAHASLFTGLYPHQHHADHEHFQLADSFVTLAERAQHQGYATAGFTCNPWLNRRSGFAQGFDQYVEVYVGTQADAHDSHKASVQAIEWLRKNAGGRRPFLLFMNYLDAHLPYTPEAEVLARLKPSAAASPRRSFSVAEAERFIGGQDRLSPADLEEVRRLYSAEVLGQDAQVGLLLDYLRSSGLLDHTLLIVTSDHGEHLGDHALMGHEFSVYEPLLRVPLILRYPAVLPVGLKVTAPASLLDVLPTILDVAGLDPPAEALPGLSLRKLIAAPSDLERPLLAEYARPVTLLKQYWGSKYPLFNLSAYDTSLASLRLGEFKYIARGAGGEQLYNLESDPDERNDLATERPDRLAVLRDRLAELQKQP